MANQTKKSVSIAGKKLSVEYVPVSSLRPAPYNPRIWSKEATEQLAESIKRFGVVDPLLCNSNPKRKGIIIGGNFRASVFKKLGITTCPVVWVDIADSEKEKEPATREKEKDSLPDANETVEIYGTFTATQVYFASISSWLWVYNHLFRLIFS